MSARERLNYIGGEWLAGTGFTENRNPSDLGDVIGLYAQADAGQVRQAVAAARAALPGWAAATPQLRAEILERAGLEIMARREELG